MYLTLFTLLSWRLQLFNGCEISFQSWYSGCSTQIHVLPERFWLLIKKRISTFLRRSMSVLNAESKMALLTLGWEDGARRWLWVGHLRLQCFRAESGSCILLSPGRVCTEAWNTGGGRQAEGWLWKGGGRRTAAHGTFRWSAWGRAQPANWPAVLALPGESCGPQRTLTWFGDC